MKWYLANGYLAVNKISTPDVSASGLMFSEAESNKMVVNKGEVVLFAEDVKEKSLVQNLDKGWKVYYNKGGSFELRMENGEMYTMVHVRDTIMFISPDGAE